MGKGCKVKKALGWKTSSPKRSTHNKMRQTSNKKPDKSKQPKVARVELKAGGYLRGLEKLEESGIEKWRRNEEPLVS